MTSQEYLTSGPGRQLLIGSGYKEPVQLEVHIAGEHRHQVLASHRDRTGKGWEEYGERTAFSTSRRFGVPRSTPTRPRLPAAIGCAAPVASASATGPAHPRWCARASAATATQAQGGGVTASKQQLRREALYPLVADCLHVL